MSRAATSQSDLPVVVIEDHELVGESLVMALRERKLPARRVPVSSMQDLLRHLGRCRPGLVLLDLNLGTDAAGHPIDGLDMIGRLRAGGWRVVVVTGSRDRSRIAAAVAAGALGYVLKFAPLHELLHAVVEAVEGRQIMSATEQRHWSELHRRAQALSAQREERLGVLAPRERDVLDLLARGLRVAAIAEKFVVSEATVRTQVKSILRKLGVNSQIEAVAIHRAASRS
jgi:DNA-binding NarL/FixJ family response regulator